MGSYISIVNDTQDPWQCKMGPDQAAIKIASVIVGTIGAVATSIASLGSTVPLFAALSTNGVVTVFGVSTSALVTTTAGAAVTGAVLGAASRFGMTITENLAEQLSKDGYHAIPPGGSFRWGKKMPLLWQQGTCVKTVIIDEKTVRVETLYMRPIFTGAAPNSNRDYRIQKWLEKKATEKQEIRAKTNESRAMNEEAELLNEPDTQIVYFYANGTNSYQEE